MAKNDSIKAFPPGRVSCSAVVIVNPASGNYFHYARQIEETLIYLRRSGWSVELRLTNEASETRQQAREAVARQVNVVIAAGGDGTINEIIQELAGSETALGVLPFGTVNVWARETNIPLDNTGACAVLLHGETRRIDLGKVNDRYFLLMVGIGLDAVIAQAVEKKPIKRLGVLGYLLVGAWLGLGYESFRARLTINGRLLRRNALQIVVGNTQLYGGAIKYTWRAKCDDGLLDVCVVRRRSMLGRLMVVWDFLFHRDQRQQWVSYERCKTLEVHTRKPVAIQVDGDPAGYTPARITIVPGALKVIVPRQITTGLFSSSTQSPRRG
ncbi:MAG: diacylglycerol kinase family lipid kinase [Chloroflexi bacterium]|nr:MAG: diacylglycerol kinase family lipid kinase [Chloroflexota bacterium]